MHFQDVSSPFQSSEFNFQDSTVAAELKEMGLSWGEAQASAKDRTLWRNIVVALCPTV